MRQLIEEVVKELNQDLDLQELETLEDDTPLFELIDSVGVLDLILELEDRLHKRYGRYIQLANECTMDKEKTSFKTVKLLENYLERVVKEDAKS